MPSVPIANIIDALEMQFDEYASFLDLNKGEVETILLSLSIQAEEEPEGEPALLNSMPEEWDLAQRIVTTGRFVRLPSKFDVHEWALMEEFSLSVQSKHARQELLQAIHGAGAFRAFKDAIQRRKMEAGWFAFRRAGLKRIAIEWCEENKISWHG